ncbi:MAG: DUF2934 domain-containing protein [Bryobacterales bacterium]|nr:DUF2934 domain-containing protein [Bryobacterales bacterium]
MGTVVSFEVEYRSAFEDFSEKAQRVQFLTQHPGGDRKAFETALLELETAHLAYNQARDVLVRSLLPTKDGTKHDHGRNYAPNYANDVQTIAELLWESAGRPTGTAEQDWLRAEAIVKSAVAATSRA